jgi:outer membrane protein, multidrug efflux system
LGHNPAPIPRGKPIDSLSLPEVPSNLPSSILVNRPDIMQAEQDIIASNAQIGAARALYFPSFSLTALGGIASTDFPKLFKSPSPVWNLSVPLSAPIFNAGAINGQVKSAKASTQQAIVRYQISIQTAFREVEDALIDQEKTKMQIDAIEKQITALENTARFARLRFDTGYISYIDVLTAETNLFQTTLSIIQAKGHLFQSLVNIYAAMGGGWVTNVEELSK